VTGSTPLEASPSAKDDERLIGFNDRDRADARRLLSLIAGSQFQASPRNVAGQDERNRLKRHARDLYERRQKRIALFGSLMFNEPAWEMLLILYIEEGGERLSQARLVDLSGASRSTGMRWIDHLVRKAFVSREDHPTDRRRTIVSLTEKGRNLLELYLSETHP